MVFLRQPSQQLRMRRNRSRGVKSTKRMAFSFTASSPALEESTDLSLSLNIDEDTYLIPSSDSEDDVPETADETTELKVCEVVSSCDSHRASSFTTLRLGYLFVTLVVMLADGLQGTHLYILYESYGYSVASLYALGFITGGFMSPITGPLVDRIGRKKAAVLYCLLEMFINGLEQYPLLVGLIASRMVGGFTTNLLSSVFETWLDTEYRSRGLDKEKYEIVMRDSVIVSNVAAIFSGYMSHVLAERCGATGPFKGAVACTFMALLVVLAVWTENYGSANEEKPKNMVGYFQEAVTAFKSDKKMLRVGVIQALSAGSVQTFIFLWAPVLRHFALQASKETWGLDSQGEPAYGLIFGAFMAAGVTGGLLAPPIRRFVTSLLCPSGEMATKLQVVDVDGEQVEVRPMAVEVLASFCYFVSACLLLIPCTMTLPDSMSFTYSFSAFLAFELLIGVFLPCEGVIRSLYFPVSARASVMSLPRFAVNVVVSLGVASTNVISLTAAFLAISMMMLLASVLQVSLVSSREWSSLVSKMFAWQDSCTRLIVQPALVIMGLAVVNTRSIFHAALWDKSKEE